MSSDLNSLRIDRSKKRRGQPSRWAKWWILIGVGVLAAAGVGRLVYGKFNGALDVETIRVYAAGAGSGASSGDVVLNATGYIVAAHKIEVASKVIGKVAWIGVEKGDHVQKGQVLVRLEDDEYKAQSLQARGQLATLQARLAELLAGSRPQEIARAGADLESARADLVNARITLERTRKLVSGSVLARQALDDAQARYDAQAARVASLERTYELARIGPRREEIDAARGAVEQARGLVDFAQTQLDNTVIRAPVAGTILERNVEQGEFVTTGFVGDRGAKGYVVSLADLRDLQVELDISQTDFAKLSPRQKGIVTTDAFPDRKYQGFIEEVSPEANRQKATVQVKVKILDPDSYLRPEMNASVAFLSAAPAVTSNAPRKPSIVIPSSAVRDGAVFVVVDGRAVRRSVKVGPALAEGVKIEDGLIGGEDLVTNPPAGLKDGARVRQKKNS